jgi:diguanylate cyclase
MVGIDEDAEFRRRFRAGEVVFREGDKGGGAYIIDTGTVEVFVKRQGQDVRLAILGHGEIFGEMALIDERPRSATVRALSELSCLVVEAEQIRNRLRGADIITSTLLRLMLNRFRVMQGGVVPPQQKTDFLDHGLWSKGGWSSADSEYIDQYELARERLKFEQQLRRGIRDDQLRLLFQPIMDMTHDKLVGFEALVRWDHPDLGEISPIRFIGIAEEAGLIHALDAWVMSTALTTMKDIHSIVPRLDKPRLNVNLSGVCFADDHVVDHLHGLLAETHINPQSLTIEITESVLIANPKLALTILSAIKAQGARIALDDFGTGYSSLGYLQKFPIDGLKVDIGFVRDMMKNPTSEKIVRAIVDLAKALGLHVVAEGVEDRAQADRLLAMGCMHGQGYLMGRPMGHEAAIEFARAHLG